MDEWLSAKDMAERLGVSERTVYRWADPEVGKLEVKDEGTSRLFRQIEGMPPEKITSKGALQEENEQLRAEIVRLQAMLQNKEQQLSDALSTTREMSQRHDIVVMQMTRLLEYHQQPFWRKLLRRKQLPPPDGDVLDMEGKE